MARPLYQLAGARPSLGLDGHAGLWYDKFCDKWSGQWSMSSGGSGGKDSQNPKLRWIETVTRSVGASGRLAEHATRLARLVRGSGGEFRVFSTCSRFATGLGRSHPVENGFAWHPTLGTPFLPGSSVKGMVRAWAETEGEGSGSDTRLASLLGDRESGAAGTLAFMDAVPVEPVRLEADVMTPHYANWKPEDPPGDWCSPTPIPFLAMAAGAKMLFGAIPCRGASAKDAGEVMGWIAGALAWQGAGAKTAVGYGRFERDEDGTGSLEQRLEKARQAQEEEQRRAALSPVERKIEDVLANRPNMQLPASTAVFQAIGDGHWSDPADKRETIEWLKAEMERDKTWRPRSNRPQRDKAHKRTLQVMRWQRSE